MSWSPGRRRWARPSTTDSARRPVRSARSWRRRALRTSRPVSSATSSAPTPAWMTRAMPLRSGLATRSARAIRRTTTRCSSRAWTRRRPAPRYRSGSGRSSRHRMAAAATDRWSPVNVRWSFGDGATASGAAVTHAFGGPGSFTVGVTARDAVGNASSTTRNVLVTRPSPSSTPRIDSTVQSNWGFDPRATTKFRLLRLKVVAPPKGSAAQLQMFRPGVPVPEPPRPERPKAQHHALQEHGVREGGQQGSALPRRADGAAPDHGPGLRRQGRRLAPEARPAAGREGSLPSAARPEAAPVLSTATGADRSGSRRRRW